MRAAIMLAHRRDTFFCGARDDNQTLGNHPHPAATTSDLPQGEVKGAYDRRSTSFYGIK